MNTIEVRDLHMTFGGHETAVKALDGVDLDVARGSFAVLAGRSGSGKTTLLNCIGALLTPTRGTIRIDGHDFAHLDRDQRAAFRLRHMGFVFQAYNLMEILDARENVSYTLQLQGEPRKRALERADHWLAQVGLADLGRRRPSQLSGGQQQRVAVARALATGPAIVLADEPTANLDSATARALVDLLGRLNADEAVTILVSSHDPEVIAGAGTVISMADGRIGL